MDPKEHKKLVSEYSRWFEGARSSKVKQRGISQISLFSLLPEKPKLQTIYIKMIIIHQKNSVDYKETKNRAKVSSFCSEFGKKPSNIKFYEIQSSWKYFFYTTLNWDRLKLLTNFHKVRCPLLRTQQMI
jgi:hypothetical protein